MLRCQTLKFRIFQNALNIPDKLLPDNKHQFIIFSNENRLKKIEKSLRILIDKLELDKAEYLIQVVREPKVKTELSIKNYKQTAQNEGSIAGHAWEEYHENGWLRLTIPRPSDNDTNNYYFHIKFAEIVNLIEPSLVGYKYMRNIRNQDVKNHHWVIPHPQKVDKVYRLYPKHLSDPIESILKKIEQVGRT